MPITIDARYGFQSLQDILSDAMRNPGVAHEYTALRTTQEGTGGMVVHSVTANDVDGFGNNRFDFGPRGGIGGAILTAQDWNSGWGGVDDIWFTGMFLTGSGSRITNLTAGFFTNDATSVSGTMSSAPTITMSDNDGGAWSYDGYEVLPVEWHQDLLTTWDGVNIDAGQLYASIGAFVAGNRNPLDTLMADQTYYFYGNNTASDRFVGGIHDDRIFGAGGADWLDGSDGNDVIDGGTGSDILIGGAGNDRLIYSDEARTVDWLEGGSGSDTADFTYFNAGIAVDLTVQDTWGVSAAQVRAEGAAWGAGGQALATLTNMENVTGTAFDDYFRGTGNASNTFMGRGGNDTFAMSGTTTRGVVDVYNGGDGIDTLDFSNFQRAVTVNLASAGTEVLSRVAGVARQVGIADVQEIENVHGSNYADVLRGDAGDNVLDGGLSADRLTGGAGHDTFQFSTIAMSALQRDTVTDFSVIDDSIALDNGVFSALGAEGALNAAYFTANSTGVARDLNDHVIYNTATGVLSYDANGSAAGGVTQIAVISNLAHLTAADIFVI